MDHIEATMKLVNMGSTHVDEILILLMDMDIESTAAHNRCLALVAKIAVNSGMTPEMAYEFAEHLIEWELEMDGTECK
jgi:hypothetical protein